MSDDIDGVALSRLDDLTHDELDALPFGVIQVDDAGRVLLYNATESRFSGRAAAAVLGRDFFRDVAPCTDQPAFRGRFLDGVRRGGLDTGFGFTFGFEPAPVRVAVRLRQARAPGRYWILIRSLGALAPTRHRLAGTAGIDAVARRVRAEPVDPTVCEREPIHLGGAVQPHACLLACDPAAPELTVRACSDNIADILPGLRPAAAIGLPLAALLPAPLTGTIRDALAAGLLADPARPLRRELRLGAEAAPVLAAIHLHDRRLILELERLAERPEDFAAATPMQAQDAVTRLRAAASLDAAARIAVQEIRAMTGFERVLVYRFDPEWNGEAVAEDRSADWPHSLLGLRFPASDIPAQARALYARSPARFVVDRDAVPATVVLGAAAANQTVDLSHAQARALSPVHLEYQRNLGVNGSMSLSVLVEERLWGLVIGHHRTPHYVTPETRALAALVADGFALRIHELESRRLWQAQQAALTVRNRLLEQMAASDDLVGAVTRAEGATLLDLFPAGGAAFLDGERVAAIGAVPPEAALRGLAAWLRQALPPERRVFATDRLSEHHAPAADWPGLASGVLAAFVGETGREHLLLWLRPEVAATVVWGGDPAKPVVADAATGTVLPRRSFERWVEERRGQSEPWAPWQVATAESFAAGIGGVVLRQGHRIATLTAEREALARALEQKEVLAREVDHRVKNSLQIVASVLRLQGRRVTDPAAQSAFEDTYARVMSVARVHDNLRQAEDAESVDLSETLLRLCGDLATGMTERAQRLEVQAEPGLMVASRTAVALSLIATELVTNALKYAYPPGEPGRVEVSLRGRPAGGVELRVCDFGRGLAPDWATRSQAGGGLGMRVIRAMLERIGAVLEVAEGAAPGTCFTVSA
jgi:photoactive yellow protein